MAKSPTDRVKDSFDGDDRESISKYVDWTRSAIIDYLQALRRSATIIVIAVAIFETVIYSKNQTVSVASFTVARNSLVLIFLPSFVAYFFFQITADHNRALQLMYMNKEAFTLWSTKGGDNDLNTPLLGPSPLYWNVTASFYHRKNSSRTDKVEEYGRLPIMMAILFGMIAFEAQAYHVLFTSKDLQVAPLVVSLSVTVFCFTMGMVSFFTRTPSIDWRLHSDCLTHSSPVLAASALDSFARARPALAAAAGERP